MDGHSQSALVRSQPAITASEAARELQGVGMLKSALLLSGSLFVLSMSGNPEQNQHSEPHPEDPNQHQVEPEATVLTDQVIEVPIKEEAVDVQQEVNQPQIEGSHEMIAQQPHSSEQVLPDYDEVINNYERKLDRLAQQADQLRDSNIGKERRIQELAIDLQKWQEACAQKSYQIATVRAQLESTAHSKEEYKSLFEASRQRLKEFESMESVADLEVQLKQANLKINALEFEIQNSQSRCVALEGTQVDFDQVGALQTIDKLKQNLNIKQIERTVLAKQIVEFHKHVQSVNSQLSEQLVKSGDLELHIKDLSQRLKNQISNSVSLLNELRQSKELIIKRDGELAILCGKLETEIKRKRQHASSNHLVEKQALLKDYLYLQKQHTILQERLRNQISKSERSEQLLAETKHHTVSKTQYDLLAKRYIQAKKCLESAMKRLSDSGITAGNIMSEGKSFESKNILLESELQQLQHYKKIVQMTRQPPCGAEELIELSTLRQKVSKQDKLLAEAQHTVQVLEGEMASREQFLNQFKQKCFQYSGELDKMQHEHSRAIKQARQLRADHEIAQMRVKGAEARQFELLAYQGQLQKQASNWKNAYESLKEKQKIREQTLSNSKKIVEEQLPVETQIRLKVVEVPRFIISSNQETQTLSVEYHLNELRATINAGKQYLKKLAQVTEPLESFKTDLQSQKNKYTGMVSSYKQRHKALSTQKQQLDQWKSKTRQQLDKQIREEFQQLRQLVQNERLLNAMRKAKHLIEEYTIQYEKKLQEENDQGDKDQGDKEQGDKDQGDKDQGDKDQGGKTPAAEKDPDNNEDIDEELRPDDPLAL